MPRTTLVELFAHGLGVIDDARLEFGPGFNVITGETGTGKTLLLGALGLCLGRDSGVARYAITNDTRASALFVADDEELLVSRDVTSSGRLRSTVNGAPSSAAALRAFADNLVVVHGQHDSLSLSRREVVLALIDDHGVVDTSELRDVRARLGQCRSRRTLLGGDSAARQREQEFVTFQLRELEEVAIASPTELSDTLEELTRRTALRDAQVDLHDVLALLDGEGDEAVLARFAQAVARVPSHDAFTAVRDALRDALNQAREALRDLADLVDDDGFDPSEFERMEERATVLQRVARKHGGSLDLALAAQRELREQLARLLAERGQLEHLDEEILSLERREAELAAAARRSRESAGSRLSDGVSRQLARVALPNATLRFTVGGVDGSDVQILFAPNPGLDEGPLGALASGGELSRVLLALSLEAVADDVVAVFDEIDAGVGGQVAQQIGHCLAEVGRHQQVLAVTHLASVAARADHHYVVDKRVEGEVTRTVVRAVHGDERVGEIARMLAGDHASRESRALATQLLENAAQYRTGDIVSR